MAIALVFILNIGQPVSIDSKFVSLLLFDMVDTLNVYVACWSNNVLQDTVVMILPVSAIFWKWSSNE